MAMNLVFSVLIVGPVILWIGSALTLLSLVHLGGCRIDEAGIHPCVIVGIDVGETAASLFIIEAWGPLIIGPFVAVAAFIWFLIFVIKAIRRSRSPRD
jgi:hypothetical protein